MNIFNSPEKYVTASFINQQAMDGIWQRLDLMTIDPKRIIDLGCGSGELTAQIQMHYPQAKIIGVDLSQAMLEHASKHHPLSYIQARARFLPFATASVNLIIANLLLPWIADIKSVLLECKRILAPNGLFICTTLGPDTLREITPIANEFIVPQFMDMHDLGDLLLEVGFADPVMDADIYTASYRHDATLKQELIDTGLIGSDIPNDISLNILDITYELVHGHAFVAKDHLQTTKQGETKIPLANLKKALRKN